MLRPKEVADYTPVFNKIIGDFTHRLQSVREPSGSEKENEVCELDNELFKWSFESVAEMLFDKRFGCLEEEIIKEEQTFIKAVGLYLVNAFEVGFCLLGFTRSTRPRNLKSFSIILTRCTTTPNYLSGEESRNWRRSHASHQRKQSVTELALASGKLTKDDLVGNSTFATSETPSRRP